MIILTLFFYSFTLYPACCRISKGSLVLRNEVIFNAAHCLDTRVKKIYRHSTRNGNWGTECLKTSFPLPTLLYAGYNEKQKNR